MQLRLILVMAFIGFMLPLQAHSERLTNGTDYSLEFPAGWTLDETKSRFTVVHHDGSSFEGFGEAPPDITSVEVALSMLQFIALAAGMCDGEPVSKFQLSGNGWSGHGIHCNNAVSDTSPPSQMIGFTVEKDKTFFQFILYVPRQDWKTSREQYLSLFKSLRFSS